MELLMNDFLLEDWLAIAKKCGASSFPAQIDSRVLTYGFLRLMVSVNVEM